MALSTFGILSQTKRPVLTAAQHRERMLQLLYEDDWPAWTREYGSNHKVLSRWMHDNIVHAMQSCPSALVGWRATLAPPLVDKMHMHCLSGGLDAIGDKEKLLALQGKATERFSRMVANFVNEDEKNWAWVSPAWVGAPGTPLREYAQSHGWLLGQLFGQVAKSLDRSEAPSWTAWVPYPQCMQVIQRHNQVRLQQRQQMTIAPLRKMGAVWANPIDIALAQQLIAQSPEPLFLDLKAHRHATPLPENERERLQALVEVHIALGGIKELHAALVAGVLPGVGMASSTTVELPDLGDMSYE